MAKLRPFIYRRYLDYGAFANLRELKRMINEESVRRERVEDVKHGEGGIREVEFVGQVFQLIRGGRDRALAAPGPARGAAASRRAAVAARARGGATGHGLPLPAPGGESPADAERPADPSAAAFRPFDRTRLALSMGFADETSFETALLREQRRVHAHFEQVFTAPQREDGQALDRVPEGGRQRMMGRLWSRELDEQEVAAAA
jgi:[glutamine synthetase] adenylyltransferase / [glutamine synthetase]-adenylyl-L-tyrosine phosphorylase